MKKTLIEIPVAYECYLHFLFSNFKDEKQNLKNNGDYYH